jgi:hypothetical protein
MKRLLFAALLLFAAAARAQQGAPELQFDSVPDFFKLPAGMNFGEVPGVAVNSKGRIFVFTRSNSANGPAYGASAAQLLEFGPKGEYIREIGKGCMDGRRRTRCASTKTTTSGRSIKALIW